MEPTSTASAWVSGSILGAGRAPCWARAASPAARGCAQRLHRVPRDAQRQPLADASPAQDVTAEVLQATAAVKQAAASPGWWRGRNG
jgi:hypothetical protein